MPPCTMDRWDGKEASFLRGNSAPLPHPSVSAIASTHGRRVARGLGTMCVTSNVVTSLLWLHFITSLVIFI